MNKRTLFGVMATIIHIGSLRNHYGDIFILLFVCCRRRRPRQTNNREGDKICLPIFCAAYSKRFLNSHIDFRGVREASEIVYASSALP